MRTKSATQVVNATAHELRILDGEGRVVGVVAPSGRVARVAVTRHVVATVQVDGLSVPVHTIHGAAVDGLPVPRPGFRYVVSRWTADALARTGGGREDLLVPDEVERRPDGSIAGCRSFCVV